MITESRMRAAFDEWIEAFCGDKEYPPAETLAWYAWSACQADNDELVSEIINSLKWMITAFDGLSLSYQAHIEDAKLALKKYEAK